MEARARTMTRSRPRARADALGITAAALGITAAALGLSACGPPRIELRPTLPLDTSPAEAFRQNPPAPLARPTHARAAGSTRQTRLRNGLEILVAEQSALPLMTIMYVNRAAVRHEPSRVPGLAVVTGDALLTGGTRLTDDRVLFDIEVGGQQPDVGTRPDFTSIKLTLPPSALPVAVRTLARLVRRPVFSEAGIAEAKAMLIRHLRQRGISYDGLTDHLSTIGLFGEEHPWAVARRREAALVRTLTREDVVAYHKQVYRPSASALVVAGDVDAADVAALVREEFGDWRDPSKVRPRKLPSFIASQRQSTEVHAIDVGGDETTIRLVEPGVGLTHPDVHALSILANVFGGQFASRAQLRLRHGEGVTYGVNAGMGLGVDFGRFRVTTTTDHDSATKVIGVLLEELARLRSEPISPQELTTAKARHRAALEFAGSFQEAHWLALAFAARQPPNLRERALDAIDAVTATEVQRAAKKHLRANPNLYLFTDLRRNGRKLRDYGAVSRYRVNFGR